MVWCSHCGGDHPQLRDPVTCSVCCSFCSKIHQFDVFTEEPTFVKGSGGESRLAGSFVNSFQSDYSESFKRTIDKGKHKIHELAVALGIEDGSATDLAHAFYKIAVERSFTKGRRTDQVAAACLYIACREGRKHFLLIDFSSCLSINVYVLGAVFLQLCQLLSLQEHSIVQKLVDPSLFIGRYTNALVGENVKVSKTALNIIASMKRDWMQTGRKPSGLCGAAVYISALSHGFTCSKLDIVKAVHVCEATLTKRLIEFEDTNSGSLTIEEFNRNAEVLKNEDQLSTLSDANSQNSDSVEVLCIHKDRKPHFAGLCKDCCEEFIELSGGLHRGAEPPAFQRAERERSAKSSSEKVKDPSIVLRPHKKKSSGEHIYEKEVEHFNEANQNTTEADTVNFTEHASASASAGDQATVNDAADKFQNSDCTNGVADEPDSLSDIDDDEVKGYLNTEEECYYKKIIWEEMNKEYLQEQAAKEAAAASFKDNGGASDEMRSAHELAAATRAAVAKSREERRQKRASEAKNTNAAQTAAEATRQMLTKKGLSSKINYDVLEKLFDEHPVPDTKRTRIESQHASNVDGQKFSEKRNDAYTNHNDDDEQEQTNGDAEEMGGEEAYRDEWDSRNEEEVSDYGYYYDDGGDDEY